MGDGGADTLESVHCKEDEDEDAVPISAIQKEYELVNEAGLLQPFLEQM